jgi:hypothetical protein
MFLVGLAMMVIISECDKIRISYSLIKYSLQVVWQGSSSENTAPEQMLHHRAALRWS